MYKASFLTAPIIPEGEFILFSFQQPSHKSNLTHFPPWDALKGGTDTNRSASEGHRDPGRRYSFRGSSLGRTG